MTLKDRFPQTFYRPIIYPTIFVTVVTFEIFPSFVWNEKQPYKCSSHVNTQFYEKKGILYTEVGNFSSLNRGVEPGFSSGTD